MSVVYGLYRQGALLYIGSTENASMRRKHLKYRIAFDDFRILKEFENRHAAFAAEREAIRRFNPPLNVVGTPRGSVLMKARVRRTQLRAVVLCANIAIARYIASGCAINTLVNEACKLFRKPCENK